MHTTDAKQYLPLEKTELKSARRREAMNIFYTRCENIHVRRALDERALMGDGGNRCKLIGLDSFHVSYMLNYF